MSGRDKGFEMRDKNWLRHAANVAVAATVFAVLPATAVAASGNTCRTVPLPVPTGVVTSQVTGGDHSGRYLVGEGYEFDGTQYTFRGLLWLHGQVATVATAALAPYAQVNLTDVNREGTVVGFRTTDFTTFHTDAWLFRDGRFTLLPGLAPTDSTRAVAVNSLGDVVGTSEDDTVNPAALRAVVWPADQPDRARELVPGASFSTGVDIDDDGTALGLLGQRPDPGQRPFLWSADRGARFLTAPAGTELAEAAAIRDRWVAGTAVGDGSSVVVRWDLNTGSATVVSTQYGSASAVNRQGTIATSGALISRTGGVGTIGVDAHVTVLADNGVAAGADAPFQGQAVVWTGC
jgi:hypothetical protein